MFPHFVQSLGDAPSLRSVAGGCSFTSFSHRGMLPHFVQSLGDAPSLCSVAGGMLPRFAQSLEGRSLASLSRWGDAQSLWDAPSLRSVTGGCSLTSFGHWGMLPHFTQSLGGRSLALLSRFPFNGSIDLLQNLHSRGSTEQHFYVWEPRCGYLHKYAFKRF